MGILKIVTAPFTALGKGVGKAVLGEALDVALEKSVDKRMRWAFLSAVIVAVGFALGKCIRLIVHPQWASIIFWLCLAAACLAVYLWIW